MLVVTFKPQEEARAEAVAALRFLCAESRREPGCLAYDLLEAADGTPCLIERYRDDAAFEEHRAAPHMRVLRETVPALLHERWTVLKLKPRDVDGLSG